MQIRNFNVFVLFFILLIPPAHSAEKTRDLVIIANEQGVTKTIPLYTKITAVIIGIDRYQNVKSEKFLEYAVKDAKGVEEVLRQRYSVGDLITLYNEQATRENIIKVLQGELAKTTSDEAVIIYFAGHGITRSPQQKKLGFLIPYDGSLKDDETYKNISMQQISSDISPLIPAKHVLFVMDACFGGLLLSTRDTGAEPSRKLSYLEEITKEQVRQIITAGGENEAVLDGGLNGHSVFTGRFIEALKNNKDYITAQELGLDLEKKVYGDAMARGHKQRPLVGKIYGTGDFVFMPDSEKIRKEAQGEVSHLEAEMRDLEKMMIEMGNRKEDAKTRELEREKLFKELGLKQARLREEAAQRDDELRKKREQESLQNAEESKIQEKARGERLAYLKVQAEKMREELGNPTAAFGLMEAQAEVKRINQLMAKLEADYQTELAKQIIPIRDYYETKIGKIVGNQPPMDKMFETEEDYAKRIESAENDANTLKSELSQKEGDIIGQLKKELGEQIQPLLSQRDNLTKQEFPVGSDQIKWKFEKYDPKKKEFSLFAEINKIDVIGLLPVPKEKARNYYEHPDLLVASASFKVSAESSIFPFIFILHGDGGEKYWSGNLVVDFEKVRAKEEADSKAKVLLKLEASARAEEEVKAKAEADAKERIEAEEVKVKAQIENAKANAEIETKVRAKAEMEAEDLKRKEESLFYAFVDKKTSLMWQREDDGKERNWQAAIDYCSQLTLAGYTDWRLPTIDELKIITDENKLNPAIDNKIKFPNTRSSYYWSSTTHSYSKNYAWFVYFSNGVIIYDSKTYSYYVRCVR